MKDELVVTPKLNINGTDANEILAGYMVVIDASQKLQEALKKTAPHGRDYQNAKAGEFEAARRQYTERVTAAEEIERDYWILAQNANDYLELTGKSR